MLAAFLNSLNAVGLIFIMIAVGFVAAKIGIMKKEHKSFIVKYAMNIAVPAMCISSVFNQFEKLNTDNIVFMFAPAVISMLCTLCIALVAAKLFKLSHKRFGAFVIICAFSNSMFIGLPMCRELFGEEVVPYVIMYYIVNTMMFWTVGVAMLQSSASDVHKKGFNLIDTLKHIATPPLIALAVAIALVLLKVKLPHILMTVLGYFGNTVSPLVLMYVGFVISETSRADIKIDTSFVFSMIMRFVAAPCITLLLCLAFHMPELARNAFIAEAAMPSMTQCVIVSAAYGGDEKYAASAMTVSTLLCLIVMPVWMLILNFV